MSITIGHASIDERGSARGGSAGDQNAREVCIRAWYSHSWTVLLRPKDAAVAEKMARACEAACANPNIGYDQNQRNTLRTQARAAGWDISKIATPCECDCSSLMTVCAEAAGVDVSACYTNGNASTTFSMRAQFRATGAFDVLTDPKYLTSAAHLKRGDILVYEQGHTAMVLGESSSASVAQPSAGGNAATTPAGEIAVDGLWGPDTTKALQRHFGTSVDGVVSNQWRAYKASNPGLVGGWEWQLIPNGEGSALVKAVQAWAGMPPADQDGEIGPQTIKAIQRKLGTPVDGVVSNPSDMVKALQKLANLKLT